MSIVFLDTETTGLEVDGGHRIVEIGAVRCVDRKLTDEFRVYLNPERVMEPAAVKIHGLTDEFLADKPKFAEKAGELIEFIGGTQLHMHNAPFDRKFLDMELRRAGRPALGEVVDKVVDTLELARRRYPARGNSLNHLCARFGIDTQERTRHGALVDARLLGQVYLAMTRGQVSLGGLDELPAAGAGDLPAAAVPGVGGREIRVVRADAEELRAHGEWMRELAAGRPRAGK